MNYDPQGSRTHTHVEGSVWCRVAVFTVTVTVYSGFVIVIHRRLFQSEIIKDRTTEQTYPNGTRTAQIRAHTAPSNRYTNQSPRSPCLLPPNLPPCVQLPVSAGAGIGSVYRYQQLFGRVRLLRDARCRTARHNHRRRSSRHLRACRCLRRLACVRKARESPFATQRSWTRHLQLVKRRKQRPTFQYPRLARHMKHNSRRCERGSIKPRCSLRVTQQPGRFRCHRQRDHRSPLGR